MAIKLASGYTWIFATGNGHDTIDSIEKLRENRYDNNLGLFYRGILVGTAEFRVVSKKYLHTERVFLKRGFRRKGHGLQLYLAIIECARKLGCARLYSSMNLNKRSKRMWDYKLQDRTGIEVHFCRHCQFNDQYFIDL